MRNYNKFVAFLAPVGFFWACGCAVQETGETYGSVSVTSRAVSDGCPNGWFDGDVVTILCGQGQTPEYRDFDGTSCVRCKRDDSAKVCSGPWVPALAKIACAPGYVFVYNHDGSCKRCVSDNNGPDCRTDSDCFRTGCSGQICSHQHVITTCEWRSEYGCYEDHFCECQFGRCGWSNDPVLLQCIEDNSGPGPIPM